MSGLPRLFFCADKLLSDDGNDVVLLDELVLEFGDLVAELLLFAVGLGSERSGAVLEELSLPVIEDAGLEVVGLADGGNGLLLKQMLAKDSDLLGGELAALALGAHGFLWGALWLTGRPQKSDSGWGNTPGATSPALRRVVEALGARWFQAERPELDLPELKLPEFDLDIEEQLEKAKARFEDLREQVGFKKAA